MNDDADNNTITTCANCGKGEENSGDLKACTACKLVKYCHRECQIVHRPLHKKACKKRAAELHDEILFKERLPREDCPICFLQLPLDTRQAIFKSCCGKVICNGCIHAMAEEARGRGKIDLCAFCRTPTPKSDEEDTKRIEKMAEADNACAIYQLGMYYSMGDHGMPQDWSKANEFWLKAGKLGHATAYNNLGYSYMHGKGVDVDNKKANYYLELAAINGDLTARHNLGCMDARAGNYHRGMKHFILSAKAGYTQSLEYAKKGYMMGHVTKDEYASALRAHQRAHDERKSDGRDRAQDNLSKLSSGK